MARWMEGNPSTVIEGDGGGDSEQAPEVKPFFRLLHARLTNPHDEPLH